MNVPLCCLRQIRATSWHCPYLANRCNRITSETIKIPHPKGWGIFCALSRVKKWLGQDVCLHTGLTKLLFDEQRERKMRSILSLCLSRSGRRLFRVQSFQRLHSGRVISAVFIVGAGNVPLAEHFIDEADMIAGRIGIHETVSGGAQSLYKLGESL